MSHLVAAAPQPPMKPTDNAPQILVGGPPQPMRVNTISSYGAKADVLADVKEKLANKLNAASIEQIFNGIATLLPDGVWLETKIADGLPIVPPAGQEQIIQVRIGQQSVLMNVRMIPASSIAKATA